MGLCSFEALLSPLPQSLILDTSQEPNISPYGPNSDGSKYVCVVKTRSDVLRYLFHALAPIALDVAARIISLVKSFSSINGKIPSDIASKAFVLFSLWLPHAPQFSSLVTELFDDDRFGSPFECISDSFIEPSSTFRGPDDSTMDIDRSESTEHKRWCFIGEAAHSICKFYCEREDSRKIRLWWDWSVLFRFLPVSKLRSTESPSHIGINRNSYCSSYMG